MSEVSSVYGKCMGTFYFVTHSFCADTAINNIRQFKIKLLTTTFTQYYYFAFVHTSIQYTAGGKQTNDSNYRIHADDPTQL